MNTFLHYSERSSRVFFLFQVINYPHIREYVLNVITFDLDYLNKSVINMLVHMLQVDPMKRATMEDIK